MYIHTYIYMYRQQQAFTECSTHSPTRTFTMRNTTWNEMIVLAPKNICTRLALFVAMSRSVLCVSVCCSVLQCGAVWCSTVYCVAECCRHVDDRAGGKKQCTCSVRSNVKDCIAAWCSVTQCGAVWRGMVQCDAVCCSVLQAYSWLCWRQKTVLFFENKKIVQGMLCSWLGYARCSVLHCVAVCYSMLQCVAVCCSVLHCVAVCCSHLEARAGAKK